MDYSAHAFTGVAAVVMPVAAAYWGILLLRGTAEDDRIRMVLGFLILVGGALGIVSVLRGEPQPDLGLRRGGARPGGLIGRSSAGPCRGSPRRSAP